MVYEPQTLLGFFSSLRKLAVQDVAFGGQEISGILIATLTGCQKKFCSAKSELLIIVLSTTRKQQPRQHDSKP